MPHRGGKTPEDRSNQRWTSEEERRLKQLARGNTPTPLIADALGRTENAVWSKASELNFSLRPTNKPPYNRRRRKS